MKKVVLLGDSIRLCGYGKSVAEMLERDGYTVWQPDENSRFCQFTLRQLFDRAAEIKDSDVVHFNAGAWDICELFDDGPFTDIDTYISTMRRIAKVPKNLGVKKVIFATTTPVRAESSHNNNDFVKKYNDTIVPILESDGCAINDLYSLVNADIYRYICEDTIHLSDEGTALCATATYDCIIKAANTL